MLKSVVLSVLLIILLAISVADAQNPFTSKKAPERVSAPPMAGHPLFTKITHLQHRLNQRLSTLIREFKDTHNLTPFVALILIAFGYGLIHAIGPGHGKAVSFSFILSENRKLRDGLLFGMSVAVFHGLSGILFLLSMRLILQKSILGSLGDVTQTTQMVSGGFIALLGGGLLGRSIYLWVRNIPGHTHGHEHGPMHKGPIAAALVVGMVPCPGVVMVMMFALSLGMIGLGILLGIAISLGMAVTLTTVVLLGIFGKNISLSAISQNRKWGDTLRRIIEIAAGCGVAVLGVLLMMAALA